MSLLDTLPHTCTAKRRKRTTDSLGGSKDDFPTTLFTGRACWQQPAGESETLDYQRRSIKVTNKFYFASDPGLDERDIIVHNGFNYEVRSKSDPDCSVGLGILFKVVVEKLGPGVSI